MVQQFISLCALMFCGVASAAQGNWDIWSEYEADYLGMQIFVSHQEDEQSDTLIKQLSYSGSNITPSLFIHSNVLWVTWVNRASSKQYHLHYAKLNASSLSVLQTGIVITQDNFIYSPTIAVSKQNIPWLAWGGFDGSDEEIRVSSFQHNRWSKQSSKTDNSYSDTQPKFEFDDNDRLSLRWEQITPSTIRSKHAIIASSPLSTLAESRQNKTAQVKISQQRAKPLKQHLPKYLDKRQDDILMGQHVELKP